MAENTKKREWVKNAAIIFLSVMLVLTFFSNTIMNNSLPEVSTQYVQSGSIEAKIRGNGTVTANESYEVTIDQSRKVDSVAVRIGQPVSVGDVLFILENSDSSELEQAKEALEEAEFSYQIKLLEATKSEGNSALSENASSALRDYREKKNAYEKLKAAKNEQDKAKEEVSSASLAYETAKLHLSNLAGGEEELNEIAKLKVLIEEAEANLKAATEKYDSLEDGEEKAAALETVNAWQTAVNEYKEDLAEHEEAVQKYDVLYSEYVKAEAAFERAQSKYESLVAKGGEATESTVAQAKDAMDSARDSYNSASDALQDEEHDDEVQKKIDALNNSKEQKELQKLRDAVAELSGGDNGNEVVAKVSGTVSEINVNAGGTANAGVPMALIEQRDRGYTLSFTVSSEQAKKIKAGDICEVTNYWWGGDISAVVDSVKSDPQSQGKNKIVTVAVSGDVEVGTNLNVSIGQKSQNYDCLVPNSAVREDSNGSFVLVLTTKSSPLGNRYVATRADVKVLAKDDVSSAVSGLSNGDYVITTASKPIESGTLVRMAEG